MSNDHGRFRVELDVDAGRARRADEPAPQHQTTSDTPFCIALLGDFSGRSSRGVVERGRELAARRPVRVDRDNVDEVIARIAPQLELDVGVGSSVPVRFSTLDDFHPDRLYERLPHFRALRDTSARVSAAPPAAPRDRAAPSPPASGSVLDQILGDAPLPPGGAFLAVPSERSAPAHDLMLEEYVRRAVTPHVVPNADPSRQQALAQLDAVIQAEMRTLLHHPDFQALEALWRGVDFLVRRLETDEMLRVYLIDVSKQELSADLTGDASAESSSGMRRLLVDAAVGTPGAAPWAVLAGCYTFTSGDDDLELLEQLAKLARAAGAPWIAGAHPELAGTPSFGVAPDVDDWSRDTVPGWTALRRSRDARYLGLVLPRLLLRLPYGKDTDACEVIQLEELADKPEHEEYLWGNPAIVCALLLGEAFSESGWSLHPRLDITGLPIHIRRTAGDVEALPCAEAVLPERAMERLLDRGLMPLLSMKDGDAVRLGRFQSIAEPVASLAGRWRPSADADTR